MLLAEGVVVCGTARRLERLEKWRGNDHFHPVSLDLADPTSIEEGLKTSSRLLGGDAELVINNAGYGIFGSFGETSFELWRTQLDAALIGTARIAHVAMRQMLVRRSGCLVNVSSVAVDHPLPFMAGYNMAKAGLSALSESLIFEAGNSGVVVVDFRPGDYRTQFNQSMEATSENLHSDADPRRAGAWRMLEKNLAGAPLAGRAAGDLRRALLRGKSGTVYSGGFFQVRLAPLFSRLAPAFLRRAVAARYFGAA